MANHIEVGGRGLLTMQIIIFIMPCLITAVVLIIINDVQYYNMDIDLSDGSLNEKDVELREVTAFPDGRQSIIVTSDRNFNNSQQT